MVTEPYGVAIFEDIDGNKFAPKQALALLQMSRRYPHISDKAASRIEMTRCNIPRVRNGNPRDCSGSSDLSYRPRPERSQEPQSVDAGKLYGSDAKREDPCYLRDLSSGLNHARNGQNTPVGFAESCSGPHHRISRAATHCPKADGYPCARFVI